MCTLVGNLYIEYLNVIDVSVNCSVFLHCKRFVCWCFNKCLKIFCCLVVIVSNSLNLSYLRHDWTSSGVVAASCASGVDIRFLTYGYLYLLTWTRGKVLSWEYRSPRKRNSRPTCVRNSLLSELSWECITYLLCVGFVYIASWFVYIG